MPETQTRRTAAAKRRLDFSDDDNHNDDAKKRKVVATTTKEEAPAVVVGTPEKKKRSRRNDDSGDIASYFSSPGPKTRRTSATAALITPEPKAKAKTKTTTSRHVPIYIHKNLNYQRCGEATLGENRLAVFRMVEEHCGIPEDFENDRSYGPLSGTCFEERAIEAYDKGLLTPFSGVTICTSCGSLGHGRDECPELI